MNLASTSKYIDGPGLSTLITDAPKSIEGLEEVI